MLYPAWKRFRQRQGTGLLQARLVHRKSESGTRLISYNSEIIVD